MSVAQEHCGGPGGSIPQADSEALSRLGHTVADVCDWFRSHTDAEFPVNAAWTARDALVHIVFWHESFARNVSDIAAGLPPRPLRGTYAQLGSRATEESRGCSVGELVDRLERAQQAIEQSVFDPKVTLIPYKIGSRPYAPLEHIRVVDEHVRGHLGRIEAACCTHAPDGPTTGKR